MFVFRHGVSVRLVRCISKTLRAGGVAIKTSTDPAICREFGDCVASDAAAPKIGLTICGAAHPSCGQPGANAIYIISADSIRDAADANDAANGDPHWLVGMAAALARPRVVLVATDAFAAKFAELNFPGTAVTLAKAWCGDPGDNFAAIIAGGHSANFDALYLPASPDVLVWSTLGDETAAAEAFTAALREKMAGSASGFRPKAMSELYKNTVPDGLKICQHVAVVIPPTRGASPLTMTTLARMGVPLFVPTPAFYARNAVGNKFDPPRQTQRLNAMARLLLLDMHSWPGVRPYDSESDLVRQLGSFEIGRDLKRAVELAADGSRAAAEFDNISKTWRPLL